MISNLKYLKNEFINSFNRTSNRGKISRTSHQSKFTNPINKRCLGPNFFITLQAHTAGFARLIKL